MMLVYGKPAAFVNPAPILNKTIVWSECIQACYDYVKCVVAYQNSTGCNLFTYDYAPTVKKTTESDGFVVAFKAINTVNGGCPGGDFTNAKGFIYYIPVFFEVQVWYNITLTGSTWKISYDEIPRCPPSYFQHIDNPDGTHTCLQVLAPANVTFPHPGSYSEAVAGCKSFGATLATIDYPYYAGWFTYAIQSYINKFKAPEFYVRIDGIRKKACQSTPKTAACMSTSGFDFTSTSFKGSFDNYNFTTNSGARVESDDDCLVMVYPPATGQSMKVDVKSCSVNNKLQAYGVLCLRKAAF
ncbi:hypothetical protein CAEBREN_03055 [Caenorhabditis brenneri]|uniref:PAN-3 domain-containing protein n=1 Tax=Caenorhabditis brenneri TaxID=135651 RepID=G0MN93_CAEBE|nr:hypothetical protein CAEBREN_03055 [Caenorhabditis brenneri]